MEEKIDLFGQTLEGLQALCVQEHLPAFTAKQICDWLYVKAVDNIDGMTNLSLKTRARLNEIACVGRVEPIEVNTSVDGTRKYLFQVGEDRCVESVFIPAGGDDEGSRATLCISCQAGCRMGCRFCHTGQQGFHGNLTTSQILNQIFSVPERDVLTNVVYMGMGEPMDNYEAVMDSIKVMVAPWGRAWSPHRITVSSVGVIPQIRDFLHDCDCHLAVSLHNAFPAERGEMMPMQKVWPVAELVSMLRKENWYGQRRLSFEYTMFRGLNDDITHAAEVVRLLGNLRCRVNLIRYHATPGSRYEASTTAVMNTFRDYLNRHGIICTIRLSRGEDIMAACGLLAGRHRRQS